MRLAPAAPAPAPRAAAPVDGDATETDEYKVRAGDTRAGVATLRQLRVFASAASMDKEFTKKLLAAAGLPQGDHVVLRDADGARVLNDPVRTLRRHGLLAALHADGANAFRAVRAGGDSAAMVARLEHIGDSLVAAMPEAERRASGETRALMNPAMPHMGKAEGGLCACGATGAGSRGAKVSRRNEGGEGGRGTERPTWGDGCGGRRS